MLFYWKSFHTWSCSVWSVWVELMDKRRKEEILSFSRGESDSNARNTTDKMLPFSIEAILSAPHPNRKTPLPRKRSPSRSTDSNSNCASPLTTLADFASNTLPTDCDKEWQNSEYGEYIWTASLQEKASKFIAGNNFDFEVLEYFKRPCSIACKPYDNIFDFQRESFCFFFSPYVAIQVTLNQSCGNPKVLRALCVCLHDLHFHTNVV